MNWYTFTSKEAFDTWHEELKIRLGYPLPSFDQEGNVIGEPFTTEYTSIVKYADGDWRTIIDEEYAKDLTLSIEPIFADERETIG